jgi:hypothetical protein
VFGILAIVALAIAFIFHGAGFHGSAWVDWQSFMLLGLVFLALHLLGVAAFAFGARRNG